MEWYQNLFVGKQAEKNRQSLIDAIEKGDYSGKTWLITLAANPANQLELMAVKELKVAYHREHCRMIVGIAAGKKEAMEVLTGIVQETLDQTGGTDIRAYLTQTQE